MNRRWLVQVCLLAVAAGPAYADPADAPAYHGPVAVTVSPDGRIVYVAAQDANGISVVDIDRGEPVRTLAMPAPPTGLVLSPDGAILYVTCGGPRGTVQIIDTRSLKTRSSLPVGHTPTGPALSPDGTRLYVCNRFNHDVSVIDVAGARELVRVPVTREPIAAVVTPDGRTVYVANLLPADPANAEIVSAVVTAIDARTHETATIRLPDGSTSVRGLCASPDGKHVYVTHILSRYHLPTTQVERGWINTNALSILDGATKRHLGTVLLDELSRGAANPWGVATSADGTRICVSHAGTNELSVIDAPAMLAKLALRSAPLPANHPYDGGDGASSHVAVRDDLTFSTGLRRRVPLVGVGPRGVAVQGERAYVCEYFSDTLGVVMLPVAANAPARQIALTPPTPMTQRRRGEMLFHSADLCLQNWQSCASCHPDARVDGLNWDLINDGLGNPKNTRSMLMAHDTPPAMALGVRPSAQEAVRAGMLHIQFTVRPESDADAIDAYLQALAPVPSPHFQNGEPSESARRGERLFFDEQVGCGVCHPVPRYTDLKPYDVQSRGAYDQTDEFDTPTLMECWRTAPYMHDGRYVTLRELLEEGKHGATHGAVNELTPEQIHDLVEFLLSL